MTSLSSETVDAEAEWRQLKKHLASSKYTTSAGMRKATMQFLDEQKKRNGRRMSIQEVVGVEEPEEKPEFLLPKWSHIARRASIVSKLSRSIKSNGENASKIPALSDEIERRQSLTPHGRSKEFCFRRDEDMRFSLNSEVSPSVILAEPSTLTRTQSTPVPRQTSSFQGTIAAGKELVKRWASVYSPPESDKDDPEGESPAEHSSNTKPIGYEESPAATRTTLTTGEDEGDESNVSPGELLEDFQPRRSTSSSAKEDSTETKKSSSTTSPKRKRSGKFRRWSIEHQLSNADIPTPPMLFKTEDPSLSNTSSVEELFPKKLQDNQEDDDSAIVKGLLVLAPDRESSIRRMIKNPKETTKKEKRSENTKGKTKSKLAKYRRWTADVEGPIPTAPPTIISFPTPRPDGGENSGGSSSSIEQLFPARKEEQHDDDDMVHGLLVLAPDRERSIRSLVGKSEKTQTNTAPALPSHIEES